MFGKAQNSRMRLAVAIGIAYFLRHSGPGVFPNPGHDDALRAAQLVQQCFSIEHNCGPSHAREIVGQPPGTPF